MTKMTDTEITETHNIEMTPRLTEATVVFGGKFMSADVAREAAKSSQKNTVYVVSGGNRVFSLVSFFNAMISGRLSTVKSWRDFLSLKTEAAYMAEILKKLGVPAENIRQETMSKNTGQNVEYSYDLVKGFTSVTLASSKPHQLRVLGTFRKHQTLNHIDVVSIGAESFGITWDNWHESTDPFGRAIAGIIRWEARRMDEFDSETYVDKFAVMPNIEIEKIRASKYPKLGA
jgi:hypothetical protein